MTRLLHEAAAFWVSVTADHCLAPLTSDLSDCCTTLSGLKTDGDFAWASGWPFPSHSLEHNMLLSLAKDQTGEKGRDHTVGWSGFKAA